MKRRERIWQPEGTAKQIKLFVGCSLKSENNKRGMKKNTEYPRDEGRTCGNKFLEEFGSGGI